MSEKNTFCVVGCKLATGLHLDLKVNGDNVRHTLNGANSARIVGGYGITENIPTEFMEQWLKKNSRHPAVVNGSIFMQMSVPNAEACARDRRTVETGMAPIDPVKNGMLKNAEGVNDPEALRVYNELKAKNPERNRQVVE